SGLTAKYIDVLFRIMIFADQKDIESPLAGHNADDFYRPEPGTYATTATISGITAPVVSTLGNATTRRLSFLGRASTPSAIGKFPIGLDGLNCFRCPGENWSSSIFIAIS